MPQPAGQQHWVRSKYPLQSASARKSVQKPSPDQLSGNTHGSTATEPLRPLTNGDADQHRPMDDTQAGNNAVRTSLTSRSSSSLDTSLSSVNYHIATTVNTTEDAEEETYDPSADKPDTRTLRRTPRSRRIARISAADMDAPATEAQLQAEAPSSTVAKGSANDGTTTHETEKGSDKDDSWQRPTYPVQSPHSQTDLTRPETPPSPTPVRKQQQVPASQGQVSQSARSTTNHSSSPTESATKSTAHAGQKPNPSVPEKKFSRRKAYPLQSPANIGEFRPRTPTSTRPTSSSSHTAEDPTMQSEKPKKATRRSGYPLQSPASIANLRRPSSRSISPTQDGTAEHENVNPGISRRPSYPLQSPATATTLRDSSISEHHGPAHPATRAPSFSRSTYPLQSAALRAGPQHVVPLSFSLNAAHAERTDEDTSSNAPPPSYSSKQEDAPGRAKAILIPKNIRACKVADKPIKGRSIVVCLDGTGDKFDDDNSNIVHIVSALKKDDEQQVTYYQAGIGTYNAGGLSSGFQAAGDMAVGSGLGLHVRDAYHFLMHSYKEGDRICIFGFSRGAYTARCLAGMIHKVGLLPPRNLQQIQFAYEFYKKDTPEGWQQSEDFKRAFSIDVNVYFLGCFDSVDSVGFIPRQLPLSSTPANKARHFRHAMALDERRAKFKICRYQSAKKQGILKKVKTFNSETDSAVDEALNQVSKNKSQTDEPPQYDSETRFGRDYHPNVTEEEYQSLYGHDDDFDTDVSEVWFAGCHADVGGGAVANVERHKLAQIPLRWMIRQAFECNTGIIFKTRFLVEYGLDVHTLWPKYERLEVPKSLKEPPADFLKRYNQKLPPRATRCAKLEPVRKRGQDHHRDHHGEPFYHLNSHTDEDWTPEQVEDYYDAITPMNDQLVQAPIWWILETIPVQYKISPKPGEVKIVTGPNMGLARLVEDYTAQIHWSVVQRSAQLGYKAAARPAMHTEWRVVA